MRQNVAVGTALLVRFTGIFQEPSTHVFNGCGNGPIGDVGRDGAEVIGHER